MHYIPSVHDYSDGADAAEEPAKEALDKHRKKEVKTAIEDIIEDEFYRLEERAAEFLEHTAADRAQRFLIAVLGGDEKAAAELIGAGGHRYRSGGMDEGKPWAQVIHGRVFETSTVELRRRLVEAHPDLIRNERMADLEAAVEGLRAQVVALEADRERWVRG